MGFIPVSTTKGERLFMGIVITIALCFVWLRFVEPHYHLSLWQALIAGGILGAIIYKYG